MQKVIVIYALALLSSAFAQPLDNNLSYGKNPKLESVLSQLISSDDPQEFARIHDLYMKDGSIRVVVEMLVETALLPDYVKEETRYKKNVQILVPIEKIEDLSLENNVTFIRTPQKPYADTATPAIQTAAVKSGFNSSMQIIISIILIFIVGKKRRLKIVKK